MPANDIQVVEIDYTNWKGERGWRRITPVQLYFGHTAYHQGDQWLLLAIDVDKGAERTFAMADVHQWKKPVEERT